MNKRREHGNMPEDFECLDKDQQTKLLLWIERHIKPASRVCSQTSYGLKHVFAREGGFYVVNGAFKGAMKAAGFDPVDANELNWRFKIKVQVWNEQTTQQLMANRSAFLAHARKEIQSDPATFMRDVEAHINTTGLKDEAVYVLTSDLSGERGTSIQQATSTDIYRLFKIGKSVYQGGARVRALNRMYYGGIQWDFAHEILCNDAISLEKMMHYLFKNENVRYYRGCREIFALSAEQEQWLKRVNYVDVYALSKHIASKYRVTL